jgi:hypothetical protein
VKYPWPNYGLIELNKNNICIAVGVYVKGKVVPVHTMKIYRGEAQV